MTNDTDATCFACGEAVSRALRELAILDDGETLCVACWKEGAQDAHADSEADYTFALARMFDAERAWSVAGRWARAQIPSVGLDQQRHVFARLLHGPGTLERLSAPRS